MVNCTESEGATKAHYNSKMWRKVPFIATFAAVGGCPPYKPFDKEFIRFGIKSLKSTRE
jgi:hypothetical protein